MSESINVQMTSRCLQTGLRRLPTCSSLRVTAVEDFSSCCSNVTLSFAYTQADVSVLLISGYSRYFEREKSFGHEVHTKQHKV